MLSQLPVSLCEISMVYGIFALPPHAFTYWISSFSVPAALLGSLNCLMWGLWATIVLLPSYVGNGWVLVANFQADLESCFVHKIALFTLKNAGNRLLACVTPYNCNGWGLGMPVFVLISQVHTNRSRAGFSRNWRMCKAEFSYWWLHAQRIMAWVSYIIVTFCFWMGHIISRDNLIFTWRTWWCPHHCLL